jgi:tetratricopeptide (TPR) repeat protein
MEQSNYDVMVKVGNYYLYEDKNYEEAKKYLLIAVSHGNSEAMNNLGYYYENEGEYDKAIKYYRMAIERGNDFAMSNLGHYYHYVKKNYKEAKKYYFMAIKKGNIQSMNFLATYYLSIKNYNNAKKYYLMAIKKGDDEAALVLGNYYEYKENDYDTADKYYQMVIDKYYPLIDNDTSIMCVNDAIKYSNNIKRKWIVLKRNFLKKINSEMPYEKSNKSNICIICQECPSDLINLNCKQKHKHYFCKKCINVWYRENKPKCAVCTTQINIDNIKITWNKQKTPQENPLKIQQKKFKKQPWKP